VQRVEQLKQVESLFDKNRDICLKLSLEYEKIPHLDADYVYKMTGVQERNSCLKKINVGQLDMLELSSMKAIVSVVKQRAESSPESEKELDSFIKSNNDLINLMQRLYNHNKNHYENLIKVMPQLVEFKKQKD